MSNHTPTRRGFNPRRPRGRSRPQSRTRIAVVGLGVVAAGAVAVALVQVVRPDGPVVPCVERIVVADGSSSAREPRLQRLSFDIVAQAAVSAVTCERSLTALVVSGGQERLVWSVDDARRFNLEGETRLAREDEVDVDAIHRHVGRALQEALTELPGGPTSLAALYETALSHSGEHTSLVVVTDGVEEPPGGPSLNVPLAPGDGLSVAASIPVTRLRVRAATLVGIGVVDTTVPLPGTTWKTELRLANETLCHKATGLTCRTYGLTAATDALRAG